MKVELKIEGKVIVIEAEGAVSLAIREERGAVVSAPVAVPAAPVAAAPAFAPASPVASVPAAAPAAPVAAVPLGAPVAAAPSAADDGLFSRLSGLRRALADAEQVPPYVVFQNKALHEMAQRLPQDMEALAQIPGVGQAKLEKYGAAFLAVINEGVAA